MDDRTGIPGNRMATSPNGRAAREARQRLEAGGMSAYDSGLRPAAGVDGRWSSTVGRDAATRPDAGASTAHLVSALQKLVATRRQALVEPLLHEKGWTIAQWADEARVDASVCMRYLKGRTNPRLRSRARMANALGLGESQLPR